LPIGNEISELVLTGATIPAANADLATIDQLEILVDNVNQFYSESFYETIQNMAGRMRAAPGYHGYHVHRVLEAAYAQWDDTSTVIPENHIIACHLHLPFDIFRDGVYILKTSGKSDVVLRINAGDVGAIRCIPCEVVSSAKAV